MNASSVMYDLAKTRQHDLLVQAENDRRARYARQLAQASRPDRTRDRRRSRHLVLRPRTQS